MWRRANRIALAVVLAPLAIIPATLLHSVGSGVAFGHHASESLGNALMFAVFGVPLAFPIVLVVGVPVHVALCRARYCSVGWHAVAGALGGFLAGFVMFNLWQLGEPSVWLAYASLAVICGAAVAVAFRLVAGAPRARASTTLAGAA
jgi:hypothetical protein